MALHLFATQRGVVQHLLAALGAGVEHHALAEDRRHERVRLGLVEILVGGPEEELVRLRSRQEDDVLVDQLEPADVAAFVADPLHEPDGVGPELLEVSVFFLAAGNPRHNRCRHVLTPHRRSYLAPHCRFAKSLSWHPVFAECEFLAVLGDRQRGLGL